MLSPLPHLNEVLSIRAQEFVFLDCVVFLCDLNEVLSIRAQEFAIADRALDVNLDNLNEVLSIRAQEFANGFGVMLPRCLPQ